MPSKRDTLQIKDTHELRVKRDENIYQANSNQKTAGMVMLIQMKQALKIVTRRKEKHFIIQKVNPLGRFQSYKHIHTQKRCPKIY